MDLFLEFVVEIDYASSRLRVYNSEDFRFDGEGEVVRLEASLDHAGQVT